MSAETNLFYLQGRQHQQALGRRALRDADDALDEWQTYARQLEAKLADREARLDQREAELTAARVQRNTLEKHFIDSGASFEPIRKEVDRVLREKGIVIDRNGTAQTVRRIR